MPFAPSERVVAAFDSSQADIAFVLTGDTVHRLSISGLSWTGSSARDSLFPEASGIELVAASSLWVAPFGAELVKLYSATTTYIYSYAPATDTFAYSSTVATEALPNSPNYRRVTSTWTELENVEGWVTGDPATLCAEGTSPATIYDGFATDTTVHILEFRCKEFFPILSTPAFAPFSLPGAPAPGAMGPAFWHSGLFVFGR